MSKTPSISVIVAAHNEEKYMGRAIRSLLNQDLARSDFEVIVVDDGSSDRTLYALELFQDEIKIIRNETCKGLPYSLNRGIHAAKGKYVVRLDADDYVHSSYLSVLSGFLEQNKYMDAVACDYYLVDDHETILDRMNCMTSPIGCGIMFRMDQLVRIGLYDEEFLRHEDSDLRIRFLKQFRIHRVELPLYRYRKHAANMTLDLKSMDHFQKRLLDKHEGGRSISWSGRGHDYTEEEMQTVVDVMRTADPQTQGKFLDRFEADFAEYVGSGKAFAVSSCAAALELAAIASRVTQGDEVIIPAHTYVATAIPFARAGAKIVWADIDKESWVVSRATLEPLVTPKTKALIVVHLYGLSCEMEPIRRLAEERGLILIEDVAQAIGATYGGKKVGSFGHMSCFSFHGAKNMTTLGEGGVLLVNDRRFESIIPGIRHNGMRPYEEPRKQYWKPAMSDVDFDIPGFWPYNFSIGEAQCALGSQILKRIDQISEKKRERALRVKGALADYPELRFQATPPKCEHVFHLLPARFIGQPGGPSRDDFMELLFEKYRIKCVVQYYPLYRYPIFQKSGLSRADCPNTDSFFDSMVSFPFHEGLKDDDIAYLIDSIKNALIELRERTK